MARLLKRFFEVMAITTTAAFAAYACAGAGGPAGSPATSPAPRTASNPEDTSALIPAGFGSLHQEDISISVTINGLTVRATPLADDFIRTLSPDSYRSLLNARESRRAQLDTIARRTGLLSLSLWYVLFNNAQQGEAPFSPRDIVFTNQGRDFKPIEVIAITAGFGEQRIRQGQTALGILVFDSALNANQPLTLTIGTQAGAGANWQSVIQRVETERARIRSRAGGGTKAGGGR